MILFILYLFLLFAAHNLIYSSYSYFHQRRIGFAPTRLADTQLGLMVVNRLHSPRGVHTPVTALRGPSCANLFTQVRWRYLLRWSGISACNH